MSTLQAKKVRGYERIIAKICELPWQELNEAEAIRVAWSYYFFSIQFRENLELACAIFPDDENLKRLKKEECDTDNLSPFQGVACAGERINHDEFMRRLLILSPIPEGEVREFKAMGSRYLDEIRSSDPMSRALSIASYEDGGLEAVFKAILRVPAFDNPSLAAFRFFLSEHIRFDSDPDQGHGSLSRHLAPDDNVVPLWNAFEQLFVEFVPRLTQQAC